MFAWRQYVMDIGDVKLNRKVISQLENLCTEFPMPLLRAQACPGLLPQYPIQLLHCSPGCARVKVRCQCVAWGSRIVSGRDVILRNRVWGWQIQIHLIPRKGTGATLWRK